MTLLTPAVNMNWPGPPLVLGIVGPVVAALVVAGVVWLIVMLSRRPAVGFGYPPGPGWTGPSQALDELATAYARGRLSREEFFQRQRDLTGWGAPGAPATGFASDLGPTSPSNPGDPASSA